ncbi:hypothetical protein D3C84_1234680 [compost metagenome]
MGHAYHPTVLHIPFKRAGDNLAQWIDAVKSIRLFRPPLWVIQLLLSGRVLREELKLLIIF